MLLSSLNAPQPQSLWWKRQQILYSLIHSFIHNFIRFLLVILSAAHAHRHDDSGESRIRQKNWWKFSRQFVTGASTKITFSSPLKIAGFSKILILLFIFSQVKYAKAIKWMYESYYQSLKCIWKQWTIPKETR